MLKVGRSETTKVVKVALSPDPIKSVKAPEAPETQPSDYGSVRIKWRGALSADFTACQFTSTRV